MEVRSEDGAAPSQWGVPRKNISQTINGCEQMAAGHHADGRKCNQVRCIGERSRAMYVTLVIGDLSGGEVSLRHICRQTFKNWIALPPINQTLEKEMFSLDVNDRVMF